MHTWQIVTYWVTNSGLFMSSEQVMSCSCRLQQQLRSPTAATSGSSHFIQCYNRVMAQESKHTSTSTMKATKQKDFHTWTVRRKKQLRYHCRATNSN